MVMSDEWDEISTDRDGMDAAKDTVLDSSFWTQVRYVLQFTKPIYNMIRFADSDQPVIGEVYEQMDTMLGLIKDIVKPRDPHLYDFIRKTVGEAKYYTTLLSICAYSKILSYVMAFNPSSRGWG